MGAHVYSVDYYYTTVEDKPGQGCKFLKMLASEEVNLLAFNAFPIGRNRTQLVIYPRKPGQRTHPTTTGLSTLSAEQSTLLDVLRLKRYLPQ